jgi:hypothetical protein
MVGDLVRAAFGVLAPALPVFLIFRKIKLAGEFARNIKLAGVEQLARGRFVHRVPTYRQTAKACKKFYSFFMVPVGKYC